MKNLIEKKKSCKNKAFNFIDLFGENIKTKFLNICGKTGQYNVPNELFQKRTKRNNRVLISWRDVRNNNLTLEQLETFEGGVTVDFINNDYFDDKDNTELKEELKNRLGSDDIVSSIISIKSENGSSSSSQQRLAFEKLCSPQNTYMYKRKKIKITKDNFKEYAICQVRSGGSGNDNWSGFLYVSIQGGQQDTKNSHSKNITIFNPACEYASEDVMMDINLTMVYFALYSLSQNDLTNDIIKRYLELMPEIEDLLKNSTYDHLLYKGNLLDYCKNHYSLIFGGHANLYDPIQIEKIKITDFGIKNKDDIRNIDFAHNEAVTFGKYYWDREKKTVLSPARPTNIFWSRHLSNMIQQDFALEDFFKEEEKRYKKRKELIE